MRIDGRPGRYLLRDGAFVFEEGVFNRHKSYPLRVADFVEKLRAEKAAAKDEQAASDPDRVRPRVRKPVSAGGRKGNTPKSG